MDKQPLYWIIMLILIIVIAALMWRDRHSYICTICGKEHKLIDGSEKQIAWCDECHKTTEMVKV